MSLATQASPKKLSLDDFLSQPETEPASEYINGQVFQKPMPKSRHSRLQLKLAQTISNILEAQELGAAFPELRCTFSSRSIVPDIAILRWENIAFDESGAPLDDVTVAPDWMIEILSSGQSANRVAGNVLYAMEYGCEVGWLVDPDDKSVLVFQSGRSPCLFEGETPLPVLSKLLEMELSVATILSWLPMKKQQSSEG
ncbi:MAG: Uma2 family endonuclease [Cyanobacteria bacterium P01_C01_bin.89]